MLPIYTQTVRRHYKAPLFLGVGLGAIGLLFTALFDQFKDQIGDFIGMMPRGMEAVVGDMAIATTPEGWLAVELFPLFVLIGMAIVGIVVGANVLGREEDERTLEIVLASHRTRRSVVLEKWLALADMLAIPMLALWLAIALGKVLFVFDVNLWHVLAACVSGWFLGLSFGSLSFAFQALLGRRNVALGLGAGLFVMSYALTIISKLLDNWQPYEVLSPIYYYNIPHTLTDGLDLGKCAVLMGLVLVGLMVALVGFTRRDVG